MSSPEKKLKVQEIKSKSVNECEDDTTNRKRKISDDSDYKLAESKREGQLAYALFGDKEQLLTKLAEANKDYGKSNDTKTTRQKPVWSDSDDEDLYVDDIIDYNKKGAPQVQKQGKYKAHLEKTFQNVLGTPAWASLNREHVDFDSDDEILQSVGHVIKISNDATNLPHNQLQFKRMKDLNRATYAEGPCITSVEFHPTSSVAIVTGSSGTATIYSIDGQINDKLHCISFENFPIRNCRISKSGTEAIVGSSKKYFYTYDLLTGTSQRIFLPKNITKLTKFEISPCGKLIAVIGRFGEVHLLDYSTKELLNTFKQEHQSTSVAFSMDSSKLMSHSSDAEICVFDIRKQNISHRFYDEGCINGSSITISPNGHLLACGSEQGVVNVYNTEHVLASKSPKPIKTIFNLTTGINITKFNHSSEILAIGSKYIADAVKLVHFPTSTVFQNFPSMQSNIGKPNVLSFSPESGYLAVGNLKKEVTLYRLKHFNNY